MPKISIVIPTCEHMEDLKRCLTSIYEKSTYDNYEIIVVENGSTSKEIKAYYDELRNGAMSSVLKIVDYYEDKNNLNEDGSKPAFNYSAVVNYGVKQSTGDYILLLNNDTQVITVNWMEELLMYAQREDVGAVGGKLYFPNRKIQHAGIVLRLGAHRTAGHSHYGQEGMNLGYMGRLCYAQNVFLVVYAGRTESKSLQGQPGPREARPRHLHLGQCIRHRPGNRTRGDQTLRCVV